ncbi:hypothetical protein OKA06_05405 [Novosphingobium sp. MW5]|nr:hypothetical protein [Novosphingobium sp. MW5]
MSYAVWIALAVVFIAVLPPIIKSARAKESKGDSSGDAGSTSSSSDSSCDSSDGGDCGGD